MVIEDLKNLLEEFEKVQNTSLEIAKKVILGNISPRDMWWRVEPSLIQLRNLSDNIKDMLLTLNPEKHLTVEKAHKRISESLQSFKEYLQQEGKDRKYDPNLAFDCLKNLLKTGTEFSVLAEEILNNPSKGIAEAIRLKELSVAKTYISTVSAPKAFVARIKLVLDQTEKIESSIESLKSELDDIKANLDRIRDELTKIRKANSEEAST